MQSRMAEEGADIVGVDICESIEMCSYPLATPDDLAETERNVKGTWPTIRGSHRRRP